MFNSCLPFTNCSSMQRLNTNCTVQNLCLHLRHQICFLHNPLLWRKHHSHGPQATFSQVLGTFLCKICFVSSLFRPETTGIVMESPADLLFPPAPPSIPPSPGWNGTPVIFWQNTAATIDCHNVLLPFRGRWRMGTHDMLTWNNTHISNTQHRT